VFEYITDPSHTPIWHVDILEDTGSAGMPAGSRGTLRMLVLGQQAKAEYQIDSNDGKGRLQARSTRGPLRFETTLYVQPIEAGSCRLTMITKVETSAVFRLAEAALESIVGAHAAGDLERLKQAMEAITAP
jgi:Polyketide cyclase / dehydrase and lipid transport